MQEKKPRTQNVKNNKKKPRTQNVKNNKKTVKILPKNLFSLAQYDLIVKCS